MWLIIVLASKFFPLMLSVQICIAQGNTVFWGGFCILRMKLSVFKKNFLVGFGNDIELFALHDQLFF